MEPHGHQRGPFDRPARVGTGGISGRHLDRSRVWSVNMVLGSLLAAAMLVLWSQAHGLTTLFVVWVGLGIAMAATLYDPVFAVITRDYPGSFRTKITLITLVAGFASTVFIPMTQGLINGFGWIPPIKLILPIALFSGGLFVACMVCHGELARLKPHPNHLTTFYLALSVGGAIGGVFAVFVAPNCFNGDVELPIGMAATAVLALVVTYKDMAARTNKAVGPAAWLGLMATTAVVAALISGLAYGTVQLVANTRLSARNFYGTLTVNDHGAGEQAERTLSHGSIIHGEQHLAADRRAWPTTYYGESDRVTKWAQTMDGRLQ